MRFFLVLFPFYYYFLRWSFSSFPLILMAKTPLFPFLLLLLLLLLCFYAFESLVWCDGFFSLRFFQCHSLVLRLFNCDRTFMIFFFSYWILATMMTRTTATAAMAMYRNVPMIMSILYGPYVVMWCIYFLAFFLVVNLKHKKDRKEKKTH